MRLQVLPMVTRSMGILLAVRIAAGITAMGTIGATGAAAGETRCPEILAGAAPLSGMSIVVVHVVQMVENGWMGAPQDEEIHPHRMSGRNGVFRAEWRPYRMPDAPMVLVCHYGRDARLRIPLEEGRQRCWMEHHHGGRTGGCHLN